MKGDELLKLSKEDLALHSIEGWNLANEWALQLTESRAEVERLKADCAMNAKEMNDLRADLAFAHNKRKDAELKIEDLKTIVQKAHDRMEDLTGTKFPKTVYLDHRFGENVVGCRYCAVTEKKV